MNKYEGMFIFSDEFKEDALDAVIGKVKAEMVATGAAVDSVTRLGRKAFARPLNKQEYGHYVVVNFSASGAQLDQIRARFKLSEDIFRVQFVRAGAPVPVAEAANAVS